MVEHVVAIIGAGCLCGTVIAFGASSLYRHCTDNQRINELTAHCMATNKPLEISQGHFSTSVKVGSAPAVPLTAPSTQMMEATPPATGFIRGKKRGEIVKTLVQSRESPKKSKMPLKVLEATISSFNGVFDKFKSEAPKNKANFILFLADIDPATSQSWCPDCVKAEPVIYKKLEAGSDDVALLKAYVGDRPTWRNPQHPLRIDSQFKLKGVPTLILWENDVIKGRLEDHEAHVERKIDALVAKN